MVVAMTDDYTQYLKISSPDKNTTEQFINSIKKRASKGKVEFGVQISIERVNSPVEESTEFE